MDHGSMQPYITKTLEHGKVLVLLAVAEGLEAFHTSLNLFLDHLGETYAECPEEVDRRLMALVSGALGTLFEGQTERIIRSQLRLADSFIHAPTAAAKLQGFRTVMGDFLEDHLPQAPGSQLSQRVALYLRACPLPELKELTVTTLAGAFGYHPDSFTKKLRQESSVLPSDQLLDERLLRAERMIKSHGARRPLKEIAACLGFHDYPHFRALMKRRAGVPPSKM